MNTGERNLAIRLRKKFQITRTYECQKQAFILKGIMKIERNKEKDKLAEDKNKMNFLSGGYISRRGSV